MTNVICVKLKEQLNLYLRQNDITASELARSSGVSKQVISQWLAGAAPRKIEQVKKVADTIGMTIDRLCFGSDSLKNSILTDHEEEINAGVFEVVLRRARTNKR